MRWLKAMRATYGSAHPLPAHPAPIRRPPPLPAVPPPQLSKSHASSTSPDLKIPIVRTKCPTLPQEIPCPRCEVVLPLPYDFYPSSSSKGSPDDPLPIRI